LEAFIAVKKGGGRAKTGGRKKTPALLLILDTPKQQWSIDAVMRGLSANSITQANQNTLSENARRASGVAKAGALEREGT